MKKNNPRISVIIVNYNAGTFLVRAVRSVIDIPGVNVVVADNGSTDESLRILKKSVKKANLRVIENGTNRGFGSAVNDAARYSNDDYIYLLNPDASLSESALKRMVETSRAYGDRAIIAPRLDNPDGSAQPSCYPPQSIRNAIGEYWLGIKGAYSKYLPVGNTPQQVNAAVAAAWLVPKTVWDELGGLSNKYFLYFEDLEMCDRANARHIPIVYDPQARVKHHHGKSSETNPETHQLFVQSALIYHGPFKKYAIDTIIRVHDLATGHFSWKKIAALAVMSSVWLLAVATIGYLLLPERYLQFIYLPDIYKSNFLLWSWANFDGEHYLRIARDGYHTFMGQSEHAFFPLYPLLIKIVSSTGIDLYLSAHIVTAVAAVCALGMVGLWAQKMTRNPMSIVTALLFSPGAVFFAALYTEPLFIALTAGVFYAVENGKWGRAIALTILATATRVTGVFVAIYLIAAMIKSGKSIGRAIGAGIISMSGLWGYMYFLARQTGDPFAWYHAQSGWQKADPTMPWVTISRYLTAVTTEWVFDLTHLVVVIEILVTCAALILVYKFWRSKSIDVAYKLYVGGCLALPLATGSLGSMPRFILTLFPVYIIIEGFSKSARRIIYGVSLLLSIIGIILFTRGYWYA